MSDDRAMYPLKPTLTGDAHTRDEAMWDGATGVAKKKTPWGPVVKKIKTSVAEAAIPDLRSIKFYHGTTKTFPGALRIGASDRDGNMDKGPGVYFTSNPENASGYAHGEGGRVFATHIDVAPHRVLTPTTKNSRSKVAKLISSAPADLQADLAANHGHERLTAQAFGHLVDTYHQNYDTFMDAAHVLHRDLFHRDTRAWADAMVKVGYDGAYVHRESIPAGASSDAPMEHYAHHFIAYNPKVAKTPGVLENVVERAFFAEAVDLDDLIDRHVDRMAGGKGDKLDPSKVDRAQLKMGIRVEMEHTKDPQRALEIALDHLAEKPNYYSRLDKAGLVDEAKDTYGDRVSQNMAHMGTSLHEWSAVPFTMVHDAETGRQVPHHDFSGTVGYGNAPSLFSASGSQDAACELCGKAPIRNIYNVCHHGKKWLMHVGSECVGKFHPEGKSGDDLERDAVVGHAKDVLKRLHAASRVGQAAQKQRPLHALGSHPLDAVIAAGSEAGDLYRKAWKKTRLTPEGLPVVNQGQGSEFPAVKWYAQNGKKAEALLGAFEPATLVPHLASHDHSWMDWKAPASKPVSESAIATVADHVRAALAPHVPAWREATRKAYRDHADMQLERHTAFFKDKAEDWRPTDRNRATGRYNDAPPASGLVSVPREGYSVHPYAHHVKAAKAGTSTADYALSDKAAEEQFAEIHDTFVARAAEKLKHMAGTRGIRNVSVDVHHAGGALHGRIRGHIDDNSHIDIDAETHTNYRYGDNAANGHMTQYTQYPFRVLGAQDGGKPVPAASADDVALHFGGVSKHAHDTAVKAAAKATRETSKARRDELSDGAKNLRDVAQAIKAHGKAHDEAEAAADPAHPGHAKLAREVEKGYQRLLSMNPHLRDSDFPKAALTDTYPRPGGARIVTGDPIDPAHPVAAGDAAERDRKAGILTRADVLKKHGYTTWPKHEDVAAHAARLKAELDALKQQKNESISEALGVFHAPASAARTIAKTWMHDVATAAKSPVYGTHYRVPAGTPYAHVHPLWDEAKDIDAPARINHPDGSTTWVHTFDNKKDAEDHLAFIRRHVAKLRGPRESVVERLTAAMIGDIGELQVDA